MTNNVIQGAPSFVLFVYRYSWTEEGGAAASQNTNKGDPAIQH
jgi:hypothetical protein